MKHFIKITLLLILITYPGWAVARNSNTAHTHTNTPIELAFVSSNSAPDFKLAAVCFLGQGDCSAGGFGKGDEDMGVDTANQCQNEGYTYTTSNCTLPNYLDKPCSYNGNYYAECQQDILRACKEAGYTLVSQCASGQKLKKTPRCPWDNNYGICCKEICPSNSSLSCSGTVVGNDTCGYDCKKCCDINCPSGTSESNPGGCGGSTRNGCNNKACYYSYSPCTPPCLHEYHTYCSDGCSTTCQCCSSCTSCKSAPPPPCVVNTYYNSTYSLYSMTPCDISSRGGYSYRLFCLRKTYANGSLIGEDIMGGNEVTNGSTSASMCEQNKRDRCSSNNSSWTNCS